jgi:hypothetical protein
MNEPKRRGRPTNAEIAARDAAKQAPGSAPVMNGDTAGQLECVESERAPADDSCERAQAYAMRIWHGQSHDLGMGDRKERIRKALEGQGLSMDGVVLPGMKSEDDWTAEDEAPVVWRTQKAA